MLPVAELESRQQSEAAPKPARRGVHVSEPERPGIALRRIREIEHHRTVERKRETFPHSLWLDRRHLVQLGNAYNSEAAGDVLFQRCLSVPGGARFLGVPQSLVAAETGVGRH